MIFSSSTMPARSKLAGSFRSHLILIAMVAMASVPAGLAQDGEISINSKVGPEQIKEWLESSDSRLTAWGAYFASTSDNANNDDAYVTIMVKVASALLGEKTAGVASP
jgi:hypothetical protein